MLLFGWFLILDPELSFQEAILARFPLIQSFCSEQWVGHDQSYTELRDPKLLTADYSQWFHPESPPRNLGIRSWASLVAQTVKRLPTMWETQVWFLGREDPLEKEMAIHSSTLAWKIPWTEKADSLQSMGSQRVGHDWVTSLSLYLKENIWKKEIYKI